MNLVSLAFKNIKKSIKDYSIYFITLLIAVCIFYVFNAIDSQTVMLDLSNSKKQMIESLIQVISFVSVFVAFVLGFLIIYANNFIIKRRKKEIGLYLTLGMSKIKVSMVLVIETFIIGLLSLVLGIILGVGLSQFVSIFTAGLFDVDMTSFQFVFSKSSLFKTIICFGLIFIIVMIFNIFSLSKFKLIDLLKAKTVNEKVRIKNKYLTFITFVLSIGLIGCAYYLLHNGALLQADYHFVIMLISGSLGTFFFFYSLASCLLKVLQQRKKTYYKGLNMFVLKQINSNVNSHVISTTVISLMLLLTIGILSTSLSLASSMNNTINDQYPADYHISDLKRTGNIDKIKEDKKYQDLVLKDYHYNRYINEGLMVQSFLTPEDRNNALASGAVNSLMNVMLESDFNSIMELYGNDYHLNLKDNEYAMVCTFNMSKDFYNRFLSSDNEIVINNHSLISVNDKCLEFNVTSSGYEDGLMIVDDSLKNEFVVQTDEIVGRFNNRISEDEGEKFSEYLKSQYDIFADSKVVMMSQTNSSTALIVFLGLYLGIIFAIASGTVLAIEQLSQSLDNIERYRILRQLGASKIMINKSLFIQIGISFMIPLLVALVHSFVGIKEINSLIQMIVQVDISKSTIYTVLFIVLVYGGYYLATYLASNRIINE